MDCKEKILSNDYYDIITDFPFNVENEDLFDLCYTILEDRYSLIYINRQGIQNLQENFFEYQRIPKIYAPMQEVAVPSAATRQVETLQNISRQTAQQVPLPAFDSYDWFVSGISAVQKPPLNLTGAGTLICIIGSGIDYRSPAFIDSSGNTRILALWDQTIQSGTPPEGFLYGSLYTQEDINLALRAEDPYAIVPSRDMTGHGTQMAAIACGNIPNQYIGAAPDARLVVVKLKECKQYLREFYLIAPDAIAYQENDIMTALSFADEYTIAFRRPTVFCLGFGTNQGDHNGSSVLSRYLNGLALQRSRAVVVCGGNEGNAGHHFLGNLRLASSTAPNVPGSDRLSTNVEVRVGEGVNGFVMELWGNAPDLFSVVIRSPGGEEIPASPLGLQQSLTYRFIYDDTVITVDSELVESASGEQLTLFRMVNPTPGIWTFRISARGAIYNGTFHMWLPVTSFLDGQVYFLTPSPYVTLTEPGMTEEVITTSTYNVENNSFYINSGRGFTRTGRIKPDLSAPGVNISTLRGKETGSSLAAALTAGAVAQFFQWAVIEGNNEVVETREIKHYLIRGATRESDQEYPNEEWGYGRLNLQKTFEVMANL